MTTLADTLTGSGTTQTAWNQLDQLLTCAICLDRYRNPKLLPCQHTFCMEPCLEGLIDYIRRQIKCPECRAEHRIPYQGIQGFPTNVTLMRFLELHFEVSGESPDPTPTVRERCGVCSEKAYLGQCAHCDKKVCPDCKEAHLDILKREIARINNQVRRGLHRLQDALAQSEKSVHHLQQNCANVAQEVDEVYGRLQKDLKEREETLKSEVKNFLQTELHNLTSLKDNLDVEVGNIQSNCELVEKHVNENSEWEDVELVDYKETFLKTLEFVRNFDPDQAEFNGRLKFQPGPDSELVHTGISHFGELVLNNPQFPTNTPAVTQTSQNLMRSKSDHRLATQFHRQEESRNFLGVGQRYSGHGSDNEGRDGRAPSPLSRRRAGESETGYRRISTQPKDFEDVDRLGNRRYGREFGGSWREDDSSGYRSRFGRDDMLREGSDPEVHPLRSVRFRQEQQDVVVPRERVFETEDAVRGPLSGIVRLMDSARVVRKLQLNEQREKQKAEEKLHPKPTPAPTPVVPQTQPVRRPQRQLSEGDEIDRIKAQNKNAQTTSTTATATTTTSTTTTASESQSRPLARRVAALQSRTSSQEDRTEPTTESPTSPISTPARRRFGRQDDTPTDVTTTTPRTVVKQTSREAEAPRDTTPTLSTSRQTSREEFKTPPSTPTRKLSVDQRSDSSKSDDKSSPSDDSGSANKRRFFTRNQSYDRGTPFKPAAPTPITESTSTSDRHHGDTTSGVSVDSARDGQEESSRSGSNPSSSQHPLAGRSQTTATKPPEEQRQERAKSPESSSSEESSSEESDSSEPTKVPTPPTPARTTVPTVTREEETPKSRYTPFRSRETASAAKPAAVESKVDGRASPGRSRVSTFSSSRSSSVENPEEKRESPAKPKFVSRFLHKQSSAASESDNESEDEEEKQAAEEAARDASIHALLARSAMARRESTGSVLGTSRDSPSSVSTRSSLYARERDDATSSRKPSSYLQDKKDTDGAENRYSSPSSRYLTRSRTTAIDDDKDDSKYPSYSRYLTRSKSSAALGADRDDSPDDRRTGSDRFRKESRFSALRRNRLGRSRSSHDINLHDDDDDGDARDAGASSYRSPRFEPTSDIARSCSHHALSREPSPEDASTAAISSWAKYLKSKYGSKLKDSKTTNRRHSTSSIYNKDSSDSSDEEGVTISLTQLGPKTEMPTSTTTTTTTTNSSRGLNLNSRLGENPRTTYLQKRRMVAKIGNRGSETGNFTWPRGIAVGPDNTIVVADSSNHRVQVFDCYGNFIKEFGTYGSAEGEFDCLAGVSVNRIGQFIISDRYNHRIQVFDPTGRFLRSFGSQGMGDGRLSYPWGITTDSLGFIYVCDKENHRVQVFQSDGNFVGKFGTLGSKLGQMEHPHYIAVSSTNKVLISDSNNHRIQIYDVNGRILSSFGSEGAEEGQFKFPRGVAVDDQGYIIVGDSGNNRIQIFSSDGTFLKSFGAWGSGDGEFKGLEGVAVTSNGNILVCDRENHRIQIF